MARYKSTELYRFDREVISTNSILVVGLDEAGRGALAGPVVAAAVILDTSEEREIAGINDSKKLSPARRHTLYEIIANEARAWATGSCTPAEIDKINILQASLLAMHRALEKLAHQWQLVLVDGNQPLPMIAPERQQLVIGGDAKSSSIAAASIMAKVTRDRLMEAYHPEYPNYDFGRHKGYATEIHRHAIQEHGLSPLHRRSFCENLVSQIRLEF